MEEYELDQVAKGTRSMTHEEREWAISEHNFLYEYVYTQDKEKRDQLSDAELASEIIRASADYVRCTF